MKLFWEIWEDKVRRLRPCAADLQRRNVRMCGRSKPVAYQTSVLLAQAGETLKFPRRRLRVAGLKSKTGFNFFFALLDFTLELALLRAFDFATFTFRKTALGVLYLVTFLVAVYLPFKKGKATGRCWGWIWRALGRMVSIDSFPDMAPTVLLQALHQQAKARRRTSDQRRVHVFRK